MSAVIDLNACASVLFPTFQRAASTLLSFYERHLFFIANFKLRIRRGTIICSDIVCLWIDILYVFIFWYLRSLLSCQVPMCYCTGTIDESTEPDPGITFGCKQTSHTISATWGNAVHAVYFGFPPLLYSCAISCNFVSVLFLHR